MPICSLGFSGRSESDSPQTITRNECSSSLRGNAFSFSRRFLISAIPIAINMQCEGLSFPLLVLFRCVLTIFLTRSYIHFWLIPALWFWPLVSLDNLWLHRYKVGGMWPRLVTALGYSMSSCILPNALQIQPAGSISLERFSSVSENSTLLNGGRSLRERRHHIPTWQSPSHGSH